MSFSFDGRAFYFRSNRPGGYGDFDLYVTTREKLRRWGRKRDSLICPPFP